MEQRSDQSLVLDPDQPLDWSFEGHLPTCGLVAGQVELPRVSQSLPPAD